MMMTTIHQTKPLFSHLLNMHKITMIMLAKQIGLPRTVMYAMLIGKPVSLEQARSVLAGSSRLTGITYTIYNVSIALLPAMTLQMDVCQCPTQPMIRAIKHPRQVVQKRKRGIISSICGLLSGRGIQ